MGYNDPTEVKFAQECFESWDHWRLVMNASWFKPYIAKWREELELRIRSKALAAILEEAADRYSKFKYEANKYLLSGQWKPKDAVGRPSKDKIKEEAQELFQSSREVEEDLLRIKSSVN